MSRLEPLSSISCEVIQARMSNIKNGCIYASIAPKLLKSLNSLGAKSVLADGTQFFSLDDSLFQMAYVGIVHEYLGSTID